MKRTIEFELEDFSHTFGDMNLEDTVTSHVKKKEKLLDEYVKNFQKRVNLCLKQHKLRQELGGTITTQVMYDRYVSTLNTLVGEFKEVTSELEKLQENCQNIKKEKVVDMNRFLNQ
jgi:predicted  nucleic acid-binding Zn-ribbon protein